jgi:hypothetical protein
LCFRGGGEIIRFEIRVGGGGGIEDKVGFYGRRCREDRCERLVSSSVMGRWLGMWRG